MNTDLTILLTLRGRFLYTLRWMWHANRVKFPFHIILADGEVHPVIDRVLSDPANFPNLSFEYHRFCDLSFTDFYRKCSLSAKSVRTKYMMMSDNDDFPIVSGILRSIEFLDREPEYLCAGGEIPNFTVEPGKTGFDNLVGMVDGFTLGYSQGVHDITFPVIFERVMDVLNRYHVTYYHTFRTPELQKIFEEVERHDFSDLTIYEQFIATRAVTLGKIRSDPFIIAYVRQKGTSMLSTYYKDWVHNLLRSNLPRDYREMATAIANECELLDSQTGDHFSELILDAQAKLMRHFLGHTMLRYRFPRLFRLKHMLQSLAIFNISPKRFREQLRTRRFWELLERDCTDRTLSLQYRTELNEITVSLNGDAFLKFVGKFAPELL